jgi:hypothetical protein
MCHDVIFGEVTTARRFRECLRFDHLHGPPSPSSRKLRLAAVVARSLEASRQQPHRHLTPDLQEALLGISLALTPPLKNLRQL